MHCGKRSCCDWCHVGESDERSGEAEVQVPISELPHPSLLTVVPSDDIREDIPDLLEIDGLHRFGTCEETAVPVNVRAAVLIAWVVDDKQSRRTELGVRI